MLKIHSRRDLACDHCYVYEHADRSWKARPKVMAEETAARTARRLADHARSHQLDSVSVILHGGEPSSRAPPASAPSAPNCAPRWARSRTWT
ncbi:hypothetical protein ACFQV4_24665 [Streptomyces thermocarboxydus]